ncbi:hypothetical protein LTR40_010194, partial [Exophiala xenobiotica]
GKQALQQRERRDQQSEDAKDGSEGKIEEVPIKAAALVHKLAQQAIGTISRTYWHGSGRFGRRRLISSKIV